MHLYNTRNKNPIFHIKEKLRKVNFKHLIATIRYLVIMNHNTNKNRNNSEQIIFSGKL